MRAGRREGVRRWRRKRHARGKARLKAVGGQGTRGAHAEHDAHVRDLGGVEAQRLVERRRFLPSRREGHAMRARARCALGSRRACGAAAAQAACTGEARLKAVGGQGTRGAHVEHVVHARDLGGVKAQRLVELVRFLPSRREGHMRCGARCGPGGGRAWAAAAQASSTGKARLKAVWGQGTRGAHIEHAVHGRDLGRVPAGNVRVEVLQVVEEPVHMSVMAETSQSAMGPHVAVAAVWLALYASRGRH